VVRKNREIALSLRAVAAGVRGEEGTRPSPESTTRRAGPLERRPGDIPSTSPWRNCHGNFARVFRDEVGQTPAKFVERVRVDAARRLLEESEAGLDRVARERGFGGADSMRRSFLRVVRVMPGEYRGRVLAGPVGLG
jgi:hypothetical protein